MDSRLKELLELARLAATAPAGLILEGFRNLELRTDIKADGSVVTRFDRESEPPAAATYSAARGLSAWCNGAPIHVAPDGNIRDCIVAHVPPANFARARLSAGFERLMRVGTHLRGCHDCWSHAQAVRGAIDVLVELGLNRWDIAATEVIVGEAGGACRIRPSHYGPGKYDVVLGNVRAVDEIAELIGFEADRAA
jgi:fructose-1,6-bisphosphatase/inositol monophosphatase family enzyme